jgi:DNA polymerase
MAIDHDRAARELLAFYVEAGVDSMLAEHPVNRLAEPALSPSSDPELSPETAVEPDATIAAPARPKLERSSAPAPPPRPAPSLSPDAAVMAAREAARSAETLEALRSILDAFDGCALKSMARQLVFSDGNPQARLMLVGEAPGREEDLEGRPFVGPSGHLLDRMLRAIGLDRGSAYVANIVPWRPPGNRDPTPQESTICLPFISRQIELVNPDVLVCLGRPASAALLGFKDGIKKSRGRFVPYQTGSRAIQAIATFHPAFLLRSPLEKRLAWRDLLAIKDALDASGGA